MAPTGLLDLPNELLCEVVSYLERDRPHLLALCRLNRRLNALTEKYLFQHAENLSETQQRLFERTLKQLPKLGETVRTFGPVPVDGFGFVTPKDFELVPTLTKLKRLQVQPCKRLMQNQDRVRIFKAKNIEAIEEVLVHAALPYAKMGDAWRLINSVMQLPEIRTLTVNDVSMGDMDMKETRMNDRMLDTDCWMRMRGWKYHKRGGQAMTVIHLAGKESTVLKSRIYSDSHRPSAFRAGDFATLLTNYAALQTLHCTNLFIEDCDDGPILPNSHRTVLDRDSIVPALKLIFRTLRELTLKLSDDVASAPRGDILDLSGFTSLEKLHVNAEYMFNLRTTMAKENLFLQLPPKLESLHMDFGSTEGFLGPYDSPDGFAYLENSGSATSSSQWLFQFPNYKARYFPRLRAVNIEDSAPERDRFRYTSLWIAPDTLTKRLSEEGINMGCYALFGPPEVYAE